jgi:hypothetical protein
MYRHGIAGSKPKAMAKINRIALLGFGWDQSLKIRNGVHVTAPIADPSGRCNRALTCPPRGGHVETIVSAPRH